MNTPPRNMSASGFALLFLSGLAGFGAYRADVVNQPLVAPVLDRITRQIYVWLPALRALPTQTWFITSGVAVALVCLLFGTLVVALFQPANAHDRLEKQLKKRSDNRKKHRAGIAE
ncbi:MAG TPA: hypothetical protein VK673_06060 [Chthoniobacterales bacterium]|nr:hypothetical protein [Chthoniobacterales bacterium]